MRSASRYGLEQQAAPRDEHCFTHTHTHRHAIKTHYHTHLCMYNGSRCGTHSHTSAVCLVPVEMKWCKMTSVAPVSACDSLRWPIKAHHYHCWEWANRPGYRRTHHLEWTRVYWSPVQCEEADGHCTGNECCAREKRGWGCYCVIQSEVLIHVEGEQWECVFE